MRGRRARRGALVLHLGQVDDAHVRAGLSVSKAVGNSVTRHAVSRKVRHLLSTRLDRLPSGTRLVVRALPAAALADSPSLARDLDAALTELVP